jgi:hypothetical protein
MAHEFSSEAVEEFYNSCHTTADGRFCGRGAKGKKVIRVPMSEAAQRSNAILRRVAADRKSKEYKTARARVNDTWANREKGQGGLRSAGASGRNSGKADAARAANARKGAATRTKGNPNKDGSAPLKGRFRTSGDRKADMIKITQLDRGSAERKAAVKAYEKAYGGK